MDLNLTGKTAVVTGASRGVGLAVVRTLVAEGVRVVGAARTITPELKGTGAEAVAVDLSTAEGAGELIERARLAVGGIDLLANCVGGADADDAVGGFGPLGDADWQRIFDLNFHSAVRVIRAALPDLLERRGSVVNISSIGALMPGAGPLHYDVAKAALTALGKGLAQELGPSGVRVNTVTPGPVRTAIWNAPDGYGARLAQEAGLPLEDFLRQVPGQLGMVTGRLAEPEEIAGQVAFLLSDRAGSTTGADHVIDGGLVKAL